MKPIRQLKRSDVPKLRKWLIKQQKDKCLICRKSMNTPCLDHSHKKRLKGTGLIRGVLCSGCNVFLAKIENNCIRYGIKINDLPKTLRRVAKYLERDHLPYIHPSEAPKPDILSKRSFNKINLKYKRVYPNRKTLKPYVYTKKNKPNQKLTKLLEKLFKEFKIKPVFLKRK